jgi:fluoride exporter
LWPAKDGIGYPDRLDRYLAVMLGAAIGGALRYALSSVVGWRFGGRLPLGTMIVNVSGCFVIGILATLLAERLDVHPNWRLFLVVGVLGGYTTFSSFAWETFESVRGGNALYGFANVVLSVVAGYGAVWCGALLARK